MPGTVTATIRLASLVTLACAAVGSSTLTGCDSNGPDQPKESPPLADPARSGPGTFYDECGFVNDESVVAITGLPTLLPVSRNGIKCRWEAAGGHPYAMFVWFRGSPIDRERLGSEASGRLVTYLEIDGRRAYTSRDPADQFCEVGIQDNDDFVYWLVDFTAADRPADVCAPVLALANLTMEKAS